MCPACIKRPLMIFIAIVIVLLILAFVFCSSCKSCKAQEEVVITPIIQEEVIIKEVEPMVVEPEVAEPTEPQVDELSMIQQDFIDNGVISDKFIEHNSVFFNKNRANATDKEMDKFSKNTMDSMNSSRLAIIVGHACDLGDKEYNDNLIQKRMNFIINTIKSKNPSIEILFSNEGQAKSPPNDTTKQDREKQRQEERRVDVYFYQ